MRGAVGQERRNAACQKMFGVHIPPRFDEQNHDSQKTTDYRRQEGVGRDAKRCLESQAGAGEKVKCSPIHKRHNENDRRYTYQTKYKRKSLGAYFTWLSSI